MINYESRQKLIEKYREDFEKKNKLKLRLLDSESKDLYPELYNISVYNKRSVELTQKATEKLNTGAYKTFSGFMKKHYKKLIDLMIHKDDKEKYYYIIDKYKQFQYSEGTTRRSVRSKMYSPHINNAFKLIYNYYWFRFYECSLASYILNDMAEEKLDVKVNSSSYICRLGCLDDMIAAGIDFGDKELIKAIQDIIMSENNTGVVTVDIIRGILKSSNEELHTLLGDFLLAARLQEGVRQAVCENADCGTPEGFLKVFEIICDNNLIRYSSIKRAVATWIGICDESNLDRISNKLVLLMRECINDKSMALKKTESNDSIEIMVALWSLGFYDVEDAIEVMKNYVSHGSRNQILTMSYYNLALDYKDFSDVTAKKIIEEYGSDFEIIAAFMPTYLSSVDYLAHQVENKENKTSPYKIVPVTHLFTSEEEARKHFDIIKNLYDEMPKKKLEFSPCIFPWYRVYLSKTQLIKRICIIAYAVGDSRMIDYASSQLSNIDISENYSSRYVYMEMLLHNPKTDLQKDMLVSYVADKETYTSRVAYSLVKNMELCDKHYRSLENMLRFKSNNIRENVIKLLLKQSGEAIVSSVSRLLDDKKEEVRTGGLDLAIQLRNNPDFEDSYRECVDIVSKIENPTPKEKILIDEISGTSSANKVLNEEGYGLYNPNQQTRLIDISIDKNILKEYFDIPTITLTKIFDSLGELIDTHRNKEYTDINGEVRLLGNGLYVIAHGKDVPYEDAFPYKEIWCEFFEKHIKTYKVLLNLYMALNHGYKDIKEPDVLKEQEILIFGKGIIECVINENIYFKKGAYIGRSFYHVIINMLMSIYEDKAVNREIAKAAITKFTEEFPKEALWYSSKSPYGKREIPFTDTGEVGFFKKCLESWKTDEEFQEMFVMFYKIDDTMEFYKADKGTNNSYGNSWNCCLNILDYMYAYNMELVRNNDVYKAIFDGIGLKSSLSGLSCFYKEKLTTYEKQKLEKYGIDEDTDIKDHPLAKSGSYFYMNTVDKILEVELRRGDTPTVFSIYIHSISCIYGMERLIDILKALGKDSLDRSTYFWSADTSKKSCLSHLLKVCYPMKGDTAEKLSKLIKDSGINEQRLIETAMYSPQWMDIIGEYICIQGFKSGCYYFMAHMNERFDDKKKAMIAKYTPLEMEMLHNGAFDLNWFKEAYEMLGEDDFNKLYDAAKYISDGSKHSRARKYADAALGRVTLSKLEATINNKRNKDLLMSYGLVPIKNKADILDRYQYLQAFLKESKQFGSQRKASEALAVEIALENLAICAGYTDVTRLTLMAETEMINSFASFLSWNEIDGVAVKLDINEYGQTSILYKKNDKLLKSAPAAIKKNPYNLEIKNIGKKLKDQYSRTKHMFEEAMENRTEFTISELLSLRDNPVISSIINNLVFISDDNETVNIGFLANEGLLDYDENEIKLGLDSSIRLAHSFDLYKNGCWHEYQRLFFSKESIEKQRKQPFKQVFRELYVKVDEELDKNKSMMFAGNQIQPQRTVGCLKNRKWIADYEEGLQKIYYKDNIVANIYALADWFSPSDIEAPTLEWVVFSNRKTFEALKLKEVPDIVYSEVMRDVDLAVSVAHAGGVDPETSHSTVEMRKVIIEFNLPLFGISNVILEGNHGIIKGKRAEYNINLGSGIIHKAGGPMINVLPVHSQSRGKLFLPFIDEDPKTAEIMSKIVLFARDEKIKDPYILKQI